MGLLKENDGKFLSEDASKQQFSGKKMLALDALSKLVHQFSTKPDIITFVKTFLLTLSGQFSILSSIAIIQKPVSHKGESIYIATGKFTHNKLLKSINLSPELRNYFLEDKNPYLLTDAKDKFLTSELGSILKDSGVKFVCPLIHNEIVIGIICIGPRISGKQFEIQDVELLATLINTMTPLLAGSYHYWELASQSAWYFSILNNIKQGIFVFDESQHLSKVNAVGIEIIRTFNPAVTGYTDLQGKHISEVFDGKDFETWAKQFIDSSHEKNSNIIGNLTARNKKIKRSYDAYICKISGNSEFEGDFLITLDDITEKKRAEDYEKELRDKLKRSERMESLGILAGGVAHDLNNMLGPLVGYPELMLLKLPEDSPIRKQVQRIGASAKGAAQVVQDLLSLARRGRYEMEPVNINSIIESYLDSPGFLKLSKERPDITVKVNLEDNIGNIMGSEPHLSKIIMNLTINAFDAMTGPGTLIIESSRQFLESLLNDYHKIEKTEYVILKFKDSGQGIEKKDIEHIFEPYYSKKKMGTSGSGLGLSVVYGILKDHKGHYDIISEPGQGTEFILYFPLTNRTSSVSGGLNDYSGHEKVLIVDDLLEQREIISEFLSNLGYRTENCANGQEAIQYLEKNHADIIVMDMIMEPGIDGLDTYREIIKKNPNQKAIIISGYSATDRVETMQQLGAGSYIRKPVTMEKIGQAVRKELDKNATAVRG